MLTLDQFYRSEFAPLFLHGKDKRTLQAYRETVSLVVDILDDPTINEINLLGPQFVAELAKRHLAPATIAKHCRHLNAIFKKLGPKGEKNRDALRKLSYTPNFQAPKQRKRPPRVFTDHEFQSLYRAFGNESEYPKHLPASHRPSFWRVVMYFVSVTALRREAVLGIEWCNVNAEGLFLVLPEAIDKKDRQRVKPITADLLLKMQDLQQHGRISGPLRNRLFPWQHGSKAWYETWNKAEKRAGVKLGLHDLKRFSGELACRAGATVLELQQHMDHANISTTLNHYVRPQTRDLVNRIIVPIPKEGYDDPLAGVDTPASFEDRIADADRTLDELRLRKLLESGVDIERLASVIQGDGPVWETSTGSKLRVFNGEGGAA